MAEHQSPPVSGEIERDVLKRLQEGPLRLREHNTLRIAPTTLKTAVWSLRRKGYNIVAEREAFGAKCNVYTLVPGAD